MQLFIFRTDLGTREKLRTIRSYLNRSPLIMDWSVDMEDVDNVLRIEASDKVKEQDMISRLRKCGVFCEPLPD